MPTQKIAKSSPLVAQLYDQAAKDAESWHNAVLYQPNEEMQILLPENASCQAVRAFLNMSDLKYTIKTRPNAEFMSPGGHITKLPFLHVGSFVVPEMEQIVSFAQGKGRSLTGHLDEDQRSDLRAFFSLAENIFSYAEIYVSWLVPEVRDEVTLVRNGSVFPWPLNHYQNWRKQRHYGRLLTLFEWHQLTLDEVLEKVRRCCETLTDLLANKEFFFGSTPTELDALVFGHLFVITTTRLPNEALSKTIRQFPELLELVRRIERVYFGQK